ncbi:MAG: hypothetical protein K2O67_05830, partial [Clostridia bacterium]|nr:hypothetical protein [Clostridia bacterium]
MIDLSSPEVQSACKKLQRTTLLTNVLMCLTCAVALAITIWAATTAKQVRADWAQITFFVLLGLIAAYFVFIMILEFKMRKTFSGYICNYVAATFNSGKEILHCGTEGNFEVFLAGDKLTVMREGCAVAVQFDLSPIKQYAFACGNVLRRVKEFLRVYYSVSPDRPQHVTVCDKVNKKEKVLTLIENGTPTKDTSKS